MYLNIPNYFRVHIRFKNNYNLIFKYNIESIYSRYIILQVGLIRLDIIWNDYS
jgi:hypothetical protein